MTIEIRAALPDDEDDLLELARHLDTVNLPHDRTALRALLATSERAFASATTSPDPHDRYVFLLREDGRALATSMLVAQHGHRDSPYVYFDVRAEERYSSTLDRHFTHHILTLGMSFQGPTELAGLVVHPSARRHPQQLGNLIASVRLAYIAHHRTAFRDELLAELLPPFRPDGTSALWEAVGRRFTGLDYRDADRLSRDNKEFIRTLFPSGDLHATLLDAEAREVLERVGPATRGVEKLLRRIGFQYAHRVDPFDGGPHFVAETDTAIERRGIRRVHDLRAQHAEAGPQLVCKASETPPYFRAILVGLGLHPAAELSGNGILLPARFPASGEKQSPKHQ